MDRNFLDFHFNLFGMHHTITPSNANDSVSFKSFIISWNLNKTKVIILTPKISTMIMSMEIHVRNSIKHTSSVSPACRKRLKGRRYIAIVADTA